MNIITLLLATTISNMQVAEIAQYSDRASCIEARDFMTITNYTGEYKYNCVDALIQ